MKTDKLFGKGRRGRRYVKSVDVIKANGMIPESSPLAEYNYEGVEFHRWDLVVRYLAIENHFSELKKFRKNLWKSQYFFNFREKIENFRNY